MSDSRSSEARRAAVLRRCAELLRLEQVDLEVVADQSMPLGEAVVLEIADTLGRGWIAKSVRRADKYRQELTAYQEWVPILGDRAPRLVSYVADLRLLLIDKLDGVVAETVPKGRKPQAFEQVGRLTRRLHDARPPEPDASFAERLMAKLERFIERSDGLVGAGDIAYARDRVGALRGLAAPTLVPCHGDNHPRNWLINEAGIVRLIDFGHAQRDVWIQDVSRMYFRYWRDPNGGAERRDAFFDGYGREPAEQDWWVLWSYAAFSGLSTIVWAHEHGDPAFENEGRRMLADLRASDSGG